VSAAAPRPVLEVDGLVAGYGAGADVVRGVSLSVDSGQMIAIVGPNGAGKSTLIKAICGLVPVRRGRVMLAGYEITGNTPHKVVRRGLGYVPQRDNVFPRLTIEENLEIGAMAFRDIDVRREKERLLDLFPSLARRRRHPAGILSGGERQMLAMARALLQRPNVMLLDEPSAGVDTKTVAVIWDQIATIHREGVATLLVEQNARQALALSDHGYVLDVGEIRYEGSGNDLLTDPRVGELYLGGRSDATLADVT
jgi:ABC-type branched-subunit amino acid transport system ATPase component